MKLFKTIVNGFQPWTIVIKKLHLRCDKVPGHPSLPFCSLEKKNSYELLRIAKITFWTSYRSFQNHYRIDQWITFTFSSIKTSAHGGLNTSRSFEYFICIHYTLFDRSYIFKMHISDNGSLFLKRCSRPKYLT